MIILEIFPIGRKVCVRNSNLETKFIFKHLSGSPGSYSSFFCSKHEKESIRQAFIFIELLFFICTVKTIFISSQYAIFCFFPLSKLFSVTCHPQNPPQALKVQNLSFRIQFERKNWQVQGPHRNS